MPSTSNGPIYDVALSFAGEDREYVEAVAEALRDRGIRVFYDHYEAASLWGKDLYEHLSQIYGQQARFTVMFISQHYARKVWTNVERESAQQRALEQHCEYVLPARFDDTEVPGVKDSTVQEDLRNTTPEDLAIRIADKLALTAPSRAKCLTVPADFVAPDYALITKPTWLPLGGSKLAFDLRQYRTIGKLLDDLFLGHLQSFVPPFSYGSQWLVGKRGHQLLAPVQWASDPGRPVQELAASWFKLAPRVAGLTVNHGWSVLRIDPAVPDLERLALQPPPIAFGCHDPKLWGAMTRSAKIMAALKGNVEQTSIDALAAGSQPFAGVFEDFFSLGRGGWVEPEGGLSDQARSNVEMYLGFNKKMH
jgi:TIR domain